MISSLQGVTNFPKFDLLRTVLKIVCLCKVMPVFLTLGVAIFFSCDVGSFDRVCLKRRSDSQDPFSQLTDHIVPPQLGSCTNAGRGIAASVSGFCSVGVSEHTKKLCIKAAAYVQFFNFWCGFYKSAPFIWGRLICKVLSLPTCKSGVAHVKWTWNLILRLF